MAVPSTILYQREAFATRLPVTHLYTASHGWLARAETGRWRAGFTKFALRMLGELVDVQFDREPGAAVQPGDILGSVEGFKAVSDLICAGRGTFLGGNPALADDLDPLQRDIHGVWLYEFEGDPDPGCLDVGGYQELLGAAIDRLLEKQRAGEADP